jgi:hypothetical protein
LCNSEISEEINLYIKALMGWSGDISGRRCLSLDLARPAAIAMGTLCRNSRPDEAGEYQFEFALPKLKDHTLIEEI